MTFPLPLTLEMASTRTLYLDLTLGLGFKFFSKVCGHTLVNHHSYDIFEWTFFSLYFHYSLVLKLFICQSIVCKSFSLIFISFLAFLVQNSCMFAFQFCSGLEQATSSSISILLQSSVYVEDLCLCQKKSALNLCCVKVFWAFFLWFCPSH
jgi:hypothetical protein